MTREEYHLNEALREREHQIALHLHGHTEALIVVTMRYDDTVPADTVEMYLPDLAVLLKCERVWARPSKLDNDSMVCAYRCEVKL